MSTVLSNPDYRPRDDSKSINSTDAKQQDLSIVLCQVSLDTNTIITFRSNLSERLRGIFADMLQPPVAPDGQYSLFVDMTWESEIPYEIYASVMRELYHSGRVSTAGPELAQQRRRLLRTANETKPDAYSQNLEDVLVDRLNKIFDESYYEIFEDGMNSVFSHKLNYLVKIYGGDAIRALDRAMHGKHANAGIIEEALKQVGNMDDATTHNGRLNLLQRGLTSSNPSIRDAASIGIEAMNDASAIESLQKAIDIEQYEQLRRNFQITLAQLQDT